MTLVVYLAPICILLPTALAYLNPGCAPTPSNDPFFGVKNTRCVYTDPLNSFLIPSTEPDLTVFVRGGNGGSISGNSEGEVYSGGQGGAIAATFSTSAQHMGGQSLTIIVATDGQSNQRAAAGGNLAGGSSGTADFNSPDQGAYLGAGGGGYSALEYGFVEYLIAGGGGGAAYQVTSAGNGGVVVSNLDDGAGDDGSRLSNAGFGAAARGGRNNANGAGCISDISDDFNGFDGGNPDVFDGGAGGSPQFDDPGVGGGGGAGYLGAGGGCGGANPGSGGGGSSGSRLLPSERQAIAMTVVDATSFQLENPSAAVVIYYQTSLAPSNPGSRKRTIRRQIRRKLCDDTETACATKSGGFECIDTTTELASCGGCVSHIPALSTGQDCSLIKHVQGVGCQQGKCIVSTCNYPYRPSRDRKKCIR